MCAQMRCAGCREAAFAHACSWVLVYGRWYPWWMTSRAVSVSVSLCIIDVEFAAGVSVHGIDGEWLRVWTLCVLSMIDGSGFGGRAKPDAPRPEAHTCKRAGPEPELT